VSAGEGSAIRLRPGDLLRQGLVGFRSKRARTLLTSLGIAIGIGAMVAVVGISASSRADLVAELDDLGTNLLQVEVGQDMFGEDSTLPTTAPSMIRALAPVESASATRSVSGINVYRNEHIPSEETGGMTVLATEPDLVDTLDVELDEGTFLNEATATYPSVVLGSVSAERLGISSLVHRPLVYIGDEWFQVIGILDEAPLAPDIDRSVMVGYDVAMELFDIDESASTIRVRTDPDHTAAVSGVLAATANPEAPNEVDISRPSDALEAKAKADDALTALLLSLGGVALVVGGVGIANVMVISVLERRSEIGVRRALGATRSHVRRQFLTESVMLAGLGGTVGVTLGAVVTMVYANSQGWLIDVPIEGLAAGVAISLVVGTLAGLYPSVRASRLAPAEAIRSS
jgi:putative ABC transport system permease protein